MDIYVKIPLLEEHKLERIKLGEEIVVHFTPISGRRAEKVNKMILSTRIGRINIRGKNDYKSYSESKEQRTASVAEYKAW